MTNIRALLLVAALGSLGALSGCSTNVRTASTGNATSLQSGSASAEATPPATRTAGHDPETSDRLQGSASSAAQGSEWAWLDGPPGPDVALEVAPFGAPALSLHLPKGWVGEEWHDPYQRPAGLFYRAADAYQEHATVHLYLCNIPTVRADIDSNISQFVSLLGAYALHIAWQPDERATLGPAHTEILVAKGKAEGKSSTYWRVLFPVADGRLKWIVAEIDETASPKVRDALRATLRSTVLQ